MTMTNLSDCRNDLAIDDQVRLLSLDRQFLKILEDIPACPSGLTATEDCRSMECAAGKQCDFAVRSLVSNVNIAATIQQRNERNLLKNLSHCTHQIGQVVSSIVRDFSNNGNCLATIQALHEFHRELQQHVATVEERAHRS